MHVTRSLRFLFVLSLLLAASAPARAQAPEQPEAKTDAGVRAEGLSTAARIEALEALASGALPKVPIAEVLEVSLDDDSSMVQRDNALRLERRNTLIAVRQARRLKTKTDEELALMEEQILLMDLERKVLALPIEVRERLVMLDGEARDRAVAEVQAEEKRAAEAREQSTRAEDETRAAQAALELDEQKRRAEQAREQALATERALLERLLARLQTVRAEQKALESQLAERASARLAVGAEDERVRQLSKRVATVTHGSEAADALYDLIVEDLRSLRADIEARLSAYGAPPKVPRVADELSIPEVRAPELQSLRSELLSLRAAIADDAEGLSKDAIEESWAELDRAMAKERKLNALRIRLLDRVSAEKAESVLGFGREGLAQLDREIYHARLFSRWLSLSWRRQLGQALLSLSSPRQIGAILFELSLIAFVVYLSRRVLAARRKLFEAARSLSMRALRNVRRVRVAHALLSAVEVVFSELVWFLAVLFAGFLLGEILQHGILQVLYALLALFTGYRLVLAATHRSLSWAASARAASARHAAQRSDKILRSVQMIGRYVLVIFLVLSIAEAAVERGYLYHLFERLAWLAALPLFVWLIRNWTGEICDAYLSVHAEGGLAASVRRARDRWYGFLVALAAFLVLVPTTVARWAHHFVLGFERSRKALAYLLRRRLERQAEESPPVVGSVAPNLPQRLLDALTLDPICEEAPLLIDRFPGLEGLRERFEAWRVDGGLGATLVVGKAGFGKTTWLHAAARALQATPVTKLSLCTRTTDPARVRAELARAAGLPEAAAASTESLSQALGTGPQRVMWIDDLHVWFVRRPGGLEGLLELERVMLATGGRVYWLASIAHHAYGFVSWINQGASVFRQVVRLMPWTEAEIQRLLSKRMAQSGFSVSYEELVVNQLEGVDADQQLLSTARDYNRLVWDYADGSPRAAIDVWRASLLPQGASTLTVRLFGAPSSAELEALGDAGRFALGGMAWHGRIDLSELATSLRLPHNAVRVEVDKLCELGVLTRCGDDLGVSVSWWPVVMRYLKRKHLVEG